jgi:hypothetical protein
MAEAKNKNSSLQRRVIDKIQTPQPAESSNPSVGFSAADKIPSWKCRPSYPQGADDPAKTSHVSATLDLLGPCSISPADSCLVRIFMML